ncbi:hypothetical protein [Christiangramia sabulilitoris]|uniref:hypothetical protein n=1 Tax=Christiangramia sabulilitoris TaxID=2583991 RepID=UPI001409AD1E|nr:hypothetical protein [Christiangramia sabulilitoris]
MIYAIGEIVLVVIGILIALGINNWNNNRITQSESHEFNQRLLKEFKGNLDLAKLKIEKMEHRINGTREILELFEQNESDNNWRSLDSLLFIVLDGVKVEFVTGTLNEGLNTGKVALIDSDLLKGKLYGLPSNIDYVREWDKTYSDYLSNYLQAFLYKNFNYRKMDNAFSKDNIGTSKFNTNWNELLLANEEFENLIDNHYFQSKAQLQFHTNLRNEIAEIKELIEIELKK